MSFKVVTIFLCLVIYQVHSFDHSTINNLDYLSSTSDVHPDHPGKCWFKTSNIFIDEGTKYYPEGKCVFYYCHKDTFMLSGAGCQNVVEKPGCKVVGQDLTKQHPNCCQKLDC